MTRGRVRLNAQYLVPLEGEVLEKHISYWSSLSVP